MNLPCGHSSPTPALAAGSQTEYDVFPRSYPSSTMRGLLPILADVFGPWDGLACPHIADAVVAAALVVAEYSHPTRWSSSS